MALEMKQSLRLSQQLVMTPQLQQAIKLLQLNRLELAEHIMGEMLENPMLEETPEVSEEEIKEDAKAEKAEKREEKKKPAARTRRKRSTRKRAKERTTSIGRTISTANRISPTPAEDSKTSIRIFHPTNRR